MERDQSVFWNRHRAVKKGCKGEMAQWKIVKPVELVLSRGERGAPGGGGTRPTSGILTAVLGWWGEG